MGVTTVISGDSHSDCLCLQAYQQESGSHHHQCTQQGKAHKQFGFSVPVFLHSGITVAHSG